MIIELKKINYYFLTCDTYSERKKHMFEEFKDFNITEINPKLNISKFKSLDIGYSRMIDTGLMNQNRNIPFQPYVLFEDDISKFKDFPETIQIPDDADLLYVGISKCSFNNISDHINNYYKIIDDNVVKIYNMLSTHGIMVCSPRGALLLQKGLFDSYLNDIDSDIPIALLQPYHNVYALKNPLVYQNKKYGGHENLTKFCIEGKIDNIVPYEYINKDRISVIMCGNNTKFLNKYYL